MYNEDLRRGGGFTNPERNYDDEPEKDLAMAVCSLVFGIVGILTGFIGLGFDIAALVMAIVVLRRRYYGRGFAIAGIVTSSVGIVLTIAMTVFICTAAGELKDDLMSTIADYFYYYSDGGMYGDDLEDDEYYDEEFEDDEYYDEDEEGISDYEDVDEEWNVEDSETEDEGDVSLDGSTRSIDTFDTYDTYDESEEDLIDTEGVFDDDSLSEIFSGEESDDWEEYDESDEE